MTGRSVRLALFLLFLVLLASAGWFGFDISQRSRRDRATFDAVDGLVRQASGRLFEVRSSLGALVAVGQGQAYWTGQLDDQLHALETALAALRLRATEPSGLNDVDAAQAAVDDIVQLAERANRLVARGQVRQASLMVFGEGLERVASAAARLDGVRRAERQARDARESDRQMQLSAGAAGTAALAVLIVAFLVPTRRPSEAATPSAADEAVDAARSPAAESTPDPMPTTEPAPTGAGSATEPVPPLAEVDTAPVPDRRRATELKAVAGLCTDFARVADSGELPGLFDRVARLIDAAGFIVWVADPGGHQLRPALAHGYGAQALSRLPAIDRAADNATAAAWRESELKVVTTNGMTPGALVAPLLTSAGCIGVVAAEVRHGRESSESTRAIARILAAQLAALVSVPSASGAADDAASEAAHG